MEINQPKSVKLKMTGHKLRSFENWEGVLKQNGRCKTDRQTDRHKTWSLA